MSAQLSTLLSAEVDAVGWSCAIVYSVCIPACLVALMAKQKWKLAPSRRAAPLSSTQGEKTSLNMVPVRANTKDMIIIQKRRSCSMLHTSSSSFLQDSKQIDSEEHMAVAAAYCAVFFRGSVRMKWADECMRLVMQDSPEALKHQRV